MTYFIGGHYKMEISKIKLTQVEPADYNPRVITEEAKKKLKNSIKQYGLIEPILINTKNNRIISGHQRYDCLVELLMEDDNLAEREFDYIIKDDCGYILDFNKLQIKNEDYEKALNIVLNNTNLMGDYDYQKLESILTELEFNGFDLEFTGFDNLADIDIDLLGDDFSFGDEETEFTESIEDDFELPAEEELEVTVEAGDFYRLGNHYLLCGDATKEEDVNKLLNGNEVELTLTDPPYNFESLGGGVFIKEEKMKTMDLIRKNNLDTFNPLDLKIYSKTNIYFHNKNLIKKYIELAEENNQSYDLAIYKKTTQVPNYKGHLITDLEYIAIIGNLDPNKGLDYETYSKLYIGAKDNDNPLSYSKPVALCSKFINLYSSKNVLDLFGGSGSTLIACEQLNRTCYMMELDPYYCQIIINRWETFTGRSAEKIS